MIPDQPPTITDLGMPPDVAEITMIHQGLIIVTGSAGCGKSTTLAALVNLINETCRHHVITRFQAAALNAARERLGGEVLLVWVVTSADHAGTRRNPVAGHRREASTQSRLQRI